MRTRADFPNLNTKTPDGIKPGGKPYKVMVVEDKEFQRKQIVQILESEKYEIVSTAANGQEALQELEKLQGSIDLITTNLDMPVLDGYALLYQIDQKYKKKPLIVFISEETTKGVMKDLIGLGMADFILKPVNRRILLERIRTVILKSRQASQN